MNAKLSFLLLALAGTAAGSAWAQATTVKLGVVRYETDAKTSGVVGIGVPPGADAAVGSATTLLLTFERALMPNLGVELVLGVPPTIEARGAGTVAFLGEVMSAKNVGPVVLFNYHFFEPGTRVRPYLGAGVAYTRFTDVKSPYGWQVHLTDSLGPVVQAGVDVAISPQWGLFASVARVDVQTRLTAIGASVLTTTIDFRPVTYAAGLSFRF